MTHRIITGDCIEVMKTLDKVDVCIFDPPYSERVHSKMRVGKGKGPDSHGSKVKDPGFASIDPAWMAKVATELARIVQRWCLIFCEVEYSLLWGEALASVGFEYIRTGAWVKPNGTPQFSGDRPGAGFEAVTICHKPGRKRWNGGGRQAVWTHEICGNHSTVSNNNRIHPTQKPLPLMVELVSLFSDPGETVLDCCAGVSTTGVAAVRLGRHYIGIEQQEKWAQIGRERLEAEAVGGDVVSYRAGQLTMFGKSKGAKQ